MSMKLDVVSRVGECALSVYGPGPRSVTTASPQRCFLVLNMAHGIWFIARAAIHSFHHWQCWQLKKLRFPMSSLSIRGGTRQAFVTGYGASNGNCSARCWLTHQS